MKFSICLTKRDIFISLMYNTYKHYAGIASIVAGILIIVMALVLPDLSDVYKVILIILGIVLPVSKPISLYYKAKTTARKMEESEQKDMYYVDDEKMKVIHGGKNFQVEWNNVYKIKEFQDYIYIYTSPAQFMVIPRRELSDEIDASFQKIILEKKKV